MASITDDGPIQATGGHSELGIKEFSRLERMLLFAVITECERCICSEGCDCFDGNKVVSCPFVPIREEYSVRNIIEWKGMVE